MKHFMLAIALLGSATTGHAATRADLTDERKTEITQLLTEQGYEVRQVQIEDGMYEVYALKDGERFEIYLDDSLAVAMTKTDD